MINISNMECGGLPPLSERADGVLRSADVFASSESGGEPPPIDPHSAMECLPPLSERADDVLRSVDVFASSESGGEPPHSIDKHSAIECLPPLSERADGVLRSVDVLASSESGGEPPHSTTVAWPHAPVHRLSECGTYFVTTGTYRKQHYFRDSVRLDVLQRGLLTVASEFGWHLEAWCMFSNHYHFVAHSPISGAETLTQMLRKLHSKLAIWINKLDNTPGRKVWHNFRDTR